MADRIITYGVPQAGTLCSADYVAMHPVLAELEMLQPDKFTPREALGFLYKIKGML